MLDKLKKSLDDAFHGIKSGASKVTLRAEEKTKITRLNLRVNTLKKEMDGILMKVGNQVYTFREEQRQGRVFQDDMVAQALDEADVIKEKIIELQQEMDRIREDYELRVKGLEIPSGAETTLAEEEKKEKIA
jgi:hypothetical protein